MSQSYEAETLLGRIVNEIEETAIALILGLMTILTFINVVLRYGFNTGIIWGLEAVTFLFAWLVLFGVSYAVKVTAHLGVDAVINLFSLPLRRVFALLAAAVCLAYAALVLKGAWDYWAPFAGLDATSGRWFPTGFENSRDQAWYEVVDMPMPEWLRWIEPVFNQGEEYEKIPRFIPYAMLPFGMALLLFRFVQATWRIWRGDQTSLIVSHEAEDAIEDVKHLNAER
ncbi:C4-dicarboxylate ABC transporter permease [Roseobacter cerasinus]|uniref:TRAP transporter small permease protein n=1 Tax=Roseobacter cerasinus TaxID=2602289 RepID=A0A640VR94_9RHOB|nr:TRAP transporter small permease [Roseobacter cerasinus]GFE49950.1 C4-dicarboxylate ABC transporter permease [Roseobacter cerasinus]